MNAYSLDLRKRAMEYLDNGHTYEEASDLFKITRRTFFNWSKLRREKGSLEFKNTPRSPHKLPDKELLEYVKKNPDAYLREIADYFNCGVTSVHDALKRLGVKYKKNRKYIEKETKKSVRYLLNS